MVGQETPKVQPWKAMKTLEQETNPVMANLHNFTTVEPTMGNAGSTVSRPIDRQTAHETKLAASAGSSQNPGK
ncbi:hypothetical protein SCUCBS95973_007330 [Sporothrix curviconia]|uniref:Uncharacterized protein n=1 Tax=Sporothrix curviconia TaxID=1260050 RepID=A0ABP0CDQ2_9PEZI